MANLKNITELPVAESAEGLNLIVNDNGAAKQIAANTVCKVKSINGAQPDESGNVQVETSWNDLKDKPFYTKTETILEKQTLGFSEEDGLYGYPFPATLNIPNGKVTVFWDGVEYECINDGSAFGNVDIMDGGDTGEPFVFFYNGIVWVVVATASTATSHEIGIVGDVVHKLDAKFIPEAKTYATPIVIWSEDSPSRMMHYSGSRYEDGTEFKQSYHTLEEYYHLADMIKWVEENKALARLSLGQYGECSVYIDKLYEVEGEPEAIFVRGDNSWVSPYHHPPKIVRAWWDFVYYIDANGVLWDRKNSGTEDIVLAVTT